MAAAVTGSKTVTTNVSPALTASALTALLAIAPENMTVAQYKQLGDALKRIPRGADPATVIGSVLL